MRPGFWQILLVIVLVLILFGYNKFPEMMKNLANGINIFKKEIKETKDATSAAIVAGAEKSRAAAATRQKQRATGKEKSASSKSVPKRRGTVKKTLKK